MELNELSAEQIEKAKACTSIDELVQLAKEEGIELTDDDLAAVSGGKEWYEFDTEAECPQFNLPR